MFSSESLAKPLVVISFFDRRSTSCLAGLFDSMSQHAAGLDFDVLVVVNQTRDFLPEMPLARFPVEVLARENSGMNIGAWDAGWRARPDRPLYVFLQDECLVTRAGWLAAYAERCREIGLGLVGESLNPAWAITWEKLRVVHSGSRMPDHFIDGVPADRLDVYLDCLRRWNIPAGQTASHLRSLVWAATWDTLVRIDGFPMGANYGECIASEIGVSKKAEAANLRVAQVRNAPFYFVSHREWNQDRPGEQYFHSKHQPNTPSWELPDRRRLDEEAERLLALIDDQSGGADYVLLVSALLGKLRDRETQIAALRKALA